MLNEIKKRSENFKNDYLPYFNNNGEMHEWNAMYKDNLYLLSLIEQTEKTFKLIANGNNDFPTWEDTVSVLNDVRLLAKEELKAIRD